MSQQPEEAFLSLSTSTLIVTDLENTVKNKRRLPLLLLLDPLSKLVQFTYKKNRKKRRQSLDSAACTTNETFTATAAKELDRKTAFTKHNIPPPPTGESLFISHICSVLSLCPLCPSFSPLPSAAANLWQANQRWHRDYPPSMAHCGEGTNTDELGPSAFALYSVSHCVARADEWPGLLDVPLSVVFLSAQELPK